MRERIVELEALTRPLEPSAAARHTLLAAAERYSQEFLEALPDAAVYRAGRPSPAFAPLPPPEAPADFEHVLHAIRCDVDTWGINPASGGHLGYIPGGGVYFAAVGDYLADVANRYAGVYFASPGAVELEQRLVRWMADLVGFPATAGGDLTSGGSIANLSAIVAARDARGVRAADVPRTCVYHTQQVHHCVIKALGTAGLGECVQRIVPMDARFRMDAGALRRCVDGDRRNGLRPWLVVASAGTTDTGSVDPLRDIAAVARGNDLWLHVDAAYGGFFVLCEEGRSALQGMELADSLVMDPHKGLFLPYGSGALIVRDVDLLAKAHAYEASYLQDATTGPLPLSPADLSPELSRPFRGLRLWLPLQLAGLAAFRAALAEKIWLARYFHRELQARPGFEVGPGPDLSVVTYRYVPARGDPDEFNRRLVEAVQQDGRIFVSSTTVDGRFLLRLAVLNFRTHLHHVDAALDSLARIARELDRG